jgi:hypothetical protein
VRPLFLAVILCACGGADSLESSTDALGAPAWIGEAKYAITRATCNASVCASDLRPWTAPFHFDSWAQQRAAITRGYFEVWQPGVTDFDNPNLWRELDVRVHYRFDPNGPFEQRYVDFLERAGNNARYAFSLRDFYPFPNGGACPTVPFRLGPDERTYEAELELYVSVNGAELRPAPNATFRGLYSSSPNFGTLCTPTLPRVIDSTGRDVTVLQAWFGDRFSSSNFDPALCTGTDCTEAVRAISGRPPFLNRFVYSGPSAGLCELIELRTVTPDHASTAPTFAGIGFWFAGAFSFVPASELQAVGNVLLRDGSPAVVHRFVAQGMCFGQGGNTGSILERRFEFKPFARFDVAPTLTWYRVWDDVSNDYLLGRARSTSYSFVASFDRQGELLRQ